MLKIITLTALLTTADGSTTCEEKTVDIPLPVVELIQKRAYILKTDLSAEDAQEIAIVSQRTSAIFDIPITVILALIEIESRYDKKAKSKKGCRGLTQLSKNTGEFLARKFHTKSFDFHSITDNIFLGTAYLHQLLQQHGGLLVALTIYNKGYLNWFINPKVSGYAKMIYRRHAYLKELLKSESNNTCSKM